MLHELPGNHGNLDWQKPLVIRDKKDVMTQHELKGWSNNKGDLIIQDAVATCERPTSQLPSWSNNLKM